MYLGEIVRDSNVILDNVIIFEKVVKANDTHMKLPRP